MNSLENSIEKDIIVGIPSGEVLFVKDIEKVKELKLAYDMVCITNIEIVPETVLSGISY